MILVHFFVKSSLQMPKELEKRNSHACYLIKERFQLINDIITRNLVTEQLDHIKLESLTNCSSRSNKKRNNSAIFNTDFKRWNGFWFTQLAIYTKSKFIKSYSIMASIYKMITTSQHLLIHISQWIKLFTVSIKNTRTTLMTSLWCLYR